MVSRDFTGQTAGIYPRVSTKPQSKKDKTSLPDQIEACREYAEDQQGMTVDWECVRKEAFTSTTMNRPELNTLLAEMKARRVHNLIIDRVDRLTRGGMLVAAAFLRQFTRAGITLHVVSMGDAEGDALVVDDDKGVKAFLDAAWVAQQDNKRRALITRRARRSRARAGYFTHGNHAPYGFQLVPAERDEADNVIDKKYVPDIEPFTKRGFHTTFALHPYAARQRIIQMFAEGWSPTRLGVFLTDQRVPTSAQLRGHGETSGVWWRTTVKLILEQDINEGKLVNFRKKYEWRPADETHEEDWLVVTTAKPGEQIDVPAKWLAELPRVDARTLAAVRVRRELAAANGGGARTGAWAGTALLAGRRGYCGICGAALRVHRVTPPPKTRSYLYYVCTKHEEAPSQCPGITLSVTKTDAHIWRWLLDELDTEEFDRPLLATGPTEPSRLARIAARTVERDAAATEQEESLTDLRTNRAYFDEQAKRLMADARGTISDYTRALIYQDIDKLGKAIAEADRKITAAERRAATGAARASIVAEADQQLDRQWAFIQSLDPTNPKDVGDCIRFLDLVGARFRVKRGRYWALGPEETHLWLDVDVELTISPAAAAPWPFDERGRRVVDSGTTSNQQAPTPSLSARDSSRTAAPPETLCL